MASRPWTAPSRAAGLPPPSDHRHHHYQTVHAHYAYHPNLLPTPPQLYSSHSIYARRYTPDKSTIEPAKTYGRDPLPTFKNNARQQRARILNEGGQRIDDMDRQLQKTISAQHGVEHYLCIHLLFL